MTDLETLRDLTRVKAVTDGEAADTDHYANAFYAIADLLGIGASPDSPAVVWQRDMFPMLQQLVKERGVAVRWANQSVDMLKDAFFPVADALRALEDYLRHTPHHNAPEAAAARKVLAKFDDANAE